MCKIMAKCLHPSGRTSASFLNLNEMSPEEGYELTHV